MERFKLHSAVHLLLIRHGKILLIRRANTGFEDGNYSVPAGHLNGGESVTVAMAREACEEACLIVDPTQFVVVHVMNRRARDGERVDFFLTVNGEVGEPKNGEPHKCDDMRWYPLHEMPQNTVLNLRQAIDCYQKGIFYSEFGWN